MSFKEILAHTIRVVHVVPVEVAIRIHKEHVSVTITRRTVIIQLFRRHACTV